MGFSSEWVCVWIKQSASSSARGVHSRAFFLPFCSSSSPAISTYPSIPGAQQKKEGVREKSSHSFSSRPPSLLLLVLFLLLLFSLQLHIHVWLHRWSHYLFRIEQRAACSSRSSWTPAGIGISSARGEELEEGDWETQEGEEEQTEGHVQGRGEEEWV